MSRKFLVLTIGLIGTLLLASCATPTAEVIEKVVTKEVEKVVEKVVTQVVKETVKETVIVEGTPKVVEKEVTKIVEKEVMVAPTFDLTGPKYGGALIYGYSGCCRDTMDQDKSNNTQCRYNGRHVLETLTIVDPATGEIRPGLATSWEIADEGREITFKLREGVKFHDGTPFNAEAVKFNMNRTRDTEPPKAAWQFLGGEKYKDTEVIDEYTVKMLFNVPHAGILVMLSDGALGIDSPTAIEELGEEYGVKGLVGTGPFMWKEWVKDSHMTFVRNPDYAWAPDFYKHQGPAYLEEYGCRDYPEMATLAAAVEIGEVNIARLNENDVVAFYDIPGFKVVMTPKAGTTRYYMMNSDRSPTNDKAVREAIQYAIDKQAVIDTPRFAGIGNVGISPLPSNMVPGGVSEFAKVTRPYDLEKAKAILDEAGWVDSDGDGIRDKDGEPLFVQFNASNQNDLMFVQPAAGMLSEIGFDVKQVAQDFSYWIEAGQTGDFHLMTMSDSGYAGPTLLWNFYHSTGPYSFTKLKNEKLDEYLDLATTTVTDERWDYVREAMKIIIEEAVTVDVMELMYTFAVADNVQDLFFAELGYQYAYDTWIKE